MGDEKSPLEHKRLLIEIDRLMREINHNTLTPFFPDLNLEEIEPLIHMVAKARGKYLQELFHLSKLEQQGKNISPDDAKNLRFNRLVYEELVYASKALETALKRGYIEVNK